MTSLPRSILEAAKKELFRAPRPIEDHIANHGDFIRGAEWLFAHLTEMAGREFNQNNLGTIAHPEFLKGARHQFALDQAALLSLRDSLVLAKQQRDCFELELKSAREEIARLKKMIDLGIGWEDLRDDKEPMR